MTQRRIIVRSGIMIPLYLCMVLVASCANPASWLVKNAVTEEADPGDLRSRLVARDLVNTLAQIPELDPVTAGIRMADPQSRYGSVLVSELERVGYIVRKGASPEAENFLSYSVRSIAHIDGPAYEFGLTVRAIKLRRQYRLQGDAIVPASSMFVFGISPDGIRVDDSIFDTETVALEKPEPQASLELPSSIGSAVRGKPLRNMFETRQSNYSSLLKDYEDIRQIILVFDNDSITLGRRNKQLTRDLLTQYDEKTDVLSVIGCSHGKTTVSGKNRALALGRSSRVREELILSGVNPGQVLDEGCWDSQHFDEMMPRRGVVLTLKRARATP